MTSLINTREASGEFDALTTLRPDEPYFALVGRDALAPNLVKEWVKQRREKIWAKRDAGTITAKEAELELRKATEAEEIAWSMTAYRAGHKMEAIAETKAPTYTGHELPQEAQRRDRIQSAKIRTAAALNAACADAQALLNLLSEDDLLISHLADCIGWMRALSDEVTPPRPKVGTQEEK